jgi:methylase of polypeptide subunit release factors
MPSRSLQDQQVELADGARRRRIEYGDFQTPPELADVVCRALASERPATIVEPTCGTGNFVLAAIHHFPSARRVLALDVNPRYVAAAQERLAPITVGLDCEIRVANFFHTDWAALFAQFADPLLVVGNPPWVTNSTLGTLGSRNHPRKENWQKRGGLEALTGKSNFDVSEWMIGRLLEAARGRRATVALLCKTAVAQKVLAQAWKDRIPIKQCEVRRFDAAEHFAAHVDACLFVCRLGPDRGTSACRVFNRLADSRPVRSFGVRDGRLIADLAAYERVKHLIGSGFRWRSGVKHDCAAVFEFRRAGSAWHNGLGERVELEPRYLYPLLKSSQVASGDVAIPRRQVLVPQRRVGEETEPLAERAPKTWRYLRRHAERLERRGSSVYRNQPPFAVFGVGPYTFSRWKVVVSGFYKKRLFAAVGPVRRRPVVCDDTCYFLPCRSAAEARQRAELLNGELASEFFDAFVFTESKRPLTAEILGLLDLDALAREVGVAPIAKD